MTLLARFENLMQKKFLVLGINHGGHDTSAALMLDGELISACEQERYSRDKHSRRFPSEAVDDCLKQAGMTIKDVREIAFAFDPVYHIQEAYLRPALGNSEHINRIINDAERIKSNFLVEDVIREQTGFSGPIRYLNHHMCHLASGYFPSGFNEALLVSYDGIGEIEAGMFATGNDGKIEVLHRDNLFPDSLGLLYSAITFFLGWRHHCDEGIVMGLATYGHPDHQIPEDGRTYAEVFEEILSSKSMYEYHVSKDWITYHKERDTWVSDQFRAVFGEKRGEQEDITQHHMDIAAALQHRLEEIVINQLRAVREETGLKHLCLSGGVALNCSLNGKIQNAAIFDEIFVQPASGDAGTAVGACYLSSVHMFSGMKPKKQHNFYLGSGFDDHDVDIALKKHGLSAQTPEDIYTATAQRLAKGEIIGWFQGRAEFGPRALGNRSILTRPYPAEMKDYLNKRVKFREEFRPFAPVVLHEYLEEYFDIQQESPHMLIACQATAQAADKIPATVHVDNSCRVQSVKESNNKRLFRLLTAFFKITGCPVLLNTSFNVKGQPIVNFPEEAIKCFLNTNIDCLVVGDHMMTKE